MADIVSPEVRSWMMSRIRGRDTKPEVLLRKSLFRRGFRYRLHDRSLPGNPDIVLPKYHAAILVHGCFWHRHEGCRFTTNPSTRVEFWTRKFEDNVARDRRNLEALQSQGWRVATVWECALKTEAPDLTVERVVEFLYSDEQMLTVGDPQLS